MNMNINSTRHVLAVSSNSIIMNYGGSYHWNTIEKPIFTGKYDWNNIIWRVFNQNNHTIFLNDNFLTNFNLYGKCGGSPGWSLGSNSLSNNWDEYWRGNISEVIIYNRILSITESKILNYYINTKKNSYLNTNLYNINQSNGFNFQLIDIGRYSNNDYLINSIFSSGGLNLISDINNNSFLNYNLNFFLIAHNNQSYEFKKNILNRKWYFTKTLTNNNNGYLKLIFYDIINNFNYNLIYSSDSFFNEYLIISHNISFNNLLIFDINSFYLNSGFYTIELNFETKYFKKDFQLLIFLIFIFFY